MTERRVLIVGAGVAGRELVGQLKKHRSLGYKIIGFIDDSESKQGRKVVGVPVIGTTDKLQLLIADNEIESVFIAIPSAQGSLIRSIVTSCQKAKVGFRIVPRTLELVQGKVSMETIRSVTLDDILGRAILKSEQGDLKRIFEGKKVLVTGAAGSIGSELCRQIAQFDPEILVMVDWWENGLFELEDEISRVLEKDKRRILVGSIQDQKRMEWIFKTFEPQIVFHAAAFKHVPMMEDHPEEAIKNNVFGTKTCAELAGKFGASKFILISTDKAVNPTSVMGATKSFAELLARYYNKQYPTKYVSVRFGNVMGSNGSVVPRFQKQIASGGPVTVTHPHMVRFFMSIPEAVQLVLQAGRIGKGGDIFVLDMGEPVKILDLAKTMIRLAGYEPEKEILIKIIGARPGEKLYEEILMKDETKRKTDHELIFETKNVLKIADSEVLETYEKLLYLAEFQDKDGIIAELLRVLPTYKQP